MPDRTVLFFNFFTLNLLSLEEDEAERASSLLRGDGPTRKTDPLRRVLRDKGFLIPSNVREKDMLRSWHEQARTSNRSLSLTVIPTLACNFRCVYCYQEHRPATMKPEVERALVRFAGENLREGGTLSITWFGGEPLLRMDLIERLTADFVELCDRRKARYSSHIVTNGYLLNRSMAERLKACRVRHAQITLDGPPEIHDRRRPLSDGRGTFDAIMENMKAASPLLPVHLRINVDQTNRSAVPEIFERIARMGLTGSLHPYLGRTYPYTGVCRDIAGDCIEDADFSLLELETTMQLIDRGFSVFRAPRAVGAYCMAERKNTYVVTPDGGLLKCWNEASDASAAVGSLVHPEKGTGSGEPDRWDRRDIFDLECADCLMLPICMGGCPYLYYRTGRLHCHPWKAHPDESLAVYYYVKRLEREREIAGTFQELVEEVKGSIQHHTGNSKEG